MNRKINVLVMTLLMCLSTIIVIVPNDLQVGATSGGGNGGEIGLNYSYIKMITQKLSDAITEAYETGDLRKGRYFGS